MIEYVLGHRQWFFTLIALGISFLLPSVVTWVFFRKKQLDADRRQRIVITLRNFSVILFLLALIVIWGPELKTLAFSVAAFAVALVVAFKEVIACAIGGVSTSILRPFTAGDLIEVPSLGVRGRVMDVSVFYATIAQTDNQARYTGKRVAVPLSVLFSHAVVNSSLLTSHEEGYALYEINVPVPPEKASEYSRYLMEAATATYAPIKDTAEKWLKNKKTEILWNLKDEYPQLGFRPVSEKAVDLTITLLVPAGNRDRFTQRILREYYKALEERRKQAQNQSTSQLSNEVVAGDRSSTVPASTA